MRRSFAAGLALACVLGVAVAMTACSAAPATARGAADQAPTPESTGGSDTGANDLVPAGYGSLRQDDISVKVRLQTVLVRAIPLDESVIRLLSPDSYRALRELRDGGGRLAQAQRAASRVGVQDPSLWYVSYFGLQPDAQYVSGDMDIVSGGRDYRPLDLIPLTAGFGSQRVGQREVQSAIYIFDHGIDTDHPLTVTVQSVPTTSWTQVIPVIERERALVRSRARGS
ncbi:MAG TPA: hypothetical protein VFK04_01850 [Gemmatimonadaceae bacterium]|nr:hypothetical protein [Gemmatimonadaceae bacterium]